MMFKAVTVPVLILVFGVTASHAQTAETPESTASIRKDVEAVLTGQDYQRQFPTTPTPPPQEARPAAPEPVPDIQFDPDAVETVLNLHDIIRYIVWALFAAGALYLAILAIRKFRRSRILSAGVEPNPVPTAEKSEAPHSPLEEIEQLARDGALADAVHLLLLRFIEDIQIKPKTTLQPALTSREVVATVSLPQPAKASLSFIVAAVERTRFGGLEIERDTFEQCLEGYRNFALGQGTGR